MANVGRIKRRLVRRAVEENLELIAGGPPIRHRRPRRLSRSLPLLLVPLALLASAYALTSAADRLAPGLEALTRLTGGGAAEPAVPAPEPPLATAGMTPPLATPQPIAAEVFPLAVERVVIDPGHGGRSIGTRTPQGVMEKELTLDIALRLKELLAEAGFEVLLTRDQDRAVALDDRARFANLRQADIFVSIHVNWIEGGNVRGVETYYLGTTDDPYVTRLAAEENRDSGYAMADLRRLLDRIYGDVRTAKSRRLAEEVQRSLHRSLSKVNPQLSDRGVKTAPFIVLVETEMPAILAEVSSLSHEREATLLAKPLYRQFIAEALADGIRSYAGRQAPAQKGS